MSPPVANADTLRLHVTETEAERITRVEERTLAVESRVETMETLPVQVARLETKVNLLLVGLGALASGAGDVLAAIVKRLIFP